VANLTSGDGPVHVTNGTVEGPQDSADPLAGTATAEPLLGQGDLAMRARLDAVVRGDVLARRSALAETDPLTGARTAAAGLADLDRELDRCHDTGATLVVAHVDVVGLTALGEHERHGAADETLTLLVSLMRAQLRSYDLVIRLGDDEFLCAMADVTLREAREWFSAIAAALATAPVAAAIATGFAEHTSGESGGDLIARADSELESSRHRDY
jgi:diguanylate cyclase (GGDEF)-like protein